MENTSIITPYSVKLEHKMYHYQSDATQFLNRLIEEKPELEQQRLENRGLLWDVELSSEEQENFEAAKVAKKPYTYYQD